jgi:hypothetical protein
LRRFVLALYHQGQTTVPRLVTLLREFGIDISKREVVRPLTTGHDGFHEETRDVLREFARGSTDALVVMPDAVFAFYNQVIIELASRYRLPAVYSYGYFARGGGLLNRGGAPPILLTSIFFPPPAPAAGERRLAPSCP